MKQLPHVTISRSDRWYQAFPDVALTRDGRLVCVFSECTHHSDRSYSCIRYCTSDDGGHSWSASEPLREPLQCEYPRGPFWNCPRITALTDGRLVAVADRIVGEDRNGQIVREYSNWLWFSGDGGRSWTSPQATPVDGLVPDRLIELKRGRFAGRWLLGAHKIVSTEDIGTERWLMRYWWSDDAGQSWQGPVLAAENPHLKLCEGSAFELPDGRIVCFMRENSGRGDDAYKVISDDGGRTWGPIVAFPLPGCHRPVGGMLDEKRVLITHRFMQGGKGWVGWWTQNAFAALTDVDSCLADSREQAHTRILPLDFDRSLASDTGYTGWVKFPDGTIFVANYIVDDHHPLAQIRGYWIDMNDFLIDDLLPQNGSRNCENL